MKRLIATGVGLVALGGFLAFQPVAGGASGSGGLTFTPVQPEQSASAAPQSPTEVAAPTASSTESSTLNAGAASSVKKSTGSGSAALHGTAPAQPPRISGGGRGGDDENDDDEEDHGDFEGHDD